jgi:hypothetical protein
MDGATANGVPEQTPILTEAERRELGALTSDLALQAIDAGDLEKAKSLIHRLVAESKGIHDAFLSWLTSMQGFIYREMGPEAFYRSQVEGYGQALAAWPERPANETFREQIEDFVLKLRSHAMPVTIEEDEEKVTMMMVGCGSGARLIQNGFYDLEKGGKGVTVAEAGPITFGRQDFPIYCTHCAIGQMMALEAGADPETLMFTIEPAAELSTGLCKFNLYKGPGRVPQAHIDTLRGSASAPS